MAISTLDMGRWIDQRKQLGEDIIQFLIDYAAIAAEQDEPGITIYASPDASMLQAAADRLLEGKGVKRSDVSSSWESGGYRPYSSKTGRELHDSLLQRIKDLEPSIYYC